MDYTGVLQIDIVLLTVDSGKEHVKILTYTCVCLTGSSNTVTNVFSTTVKICNEHITINAMWNGEMEYCHYSQLSPVYPVRHTHV